MGRLNWGTLSSIRALYERTRAEVAEWADGFEVDDAVLAGMDVKNAKLADEVGGASCRLLKRRASRLYRTPRTPAGT